MCASAPNNWTSTPESRARHARDAFPPRPQAGAALNPAALPLVLVAGAVWYVWASLNRNIARRSRREDACFKGVGVNFEGLETSLEARFKRLKTGLAFVGVLQALTLITVCSRLH